MKDRRRHSLVSSAATISALEPRKLLHSFTLGNTGTLSLSLTDAPEELNVTLENGKIRAVLKENGSAHDDKSWDAEDVKQINILLAGGDDFCRVAQNITVTSLIGGAAGNDTIYGGGGNDLINGTDGNDFVDGGKGADTIRGGNGYDILSYETRTKSVYVDQQKGGNEGEAGEGDDIDLADFEEIRGGSGNDVLKGALVAGGTAGNKLVGGDGNDTLNGTGKNDTLIGGGGNDRIDGGKGDDRIEGNSGADRLVGGLGRDFVDGGSGKDTIYGGAGIDTLNGGADRDVFYVQDGFKDYVRGGSGADVIKDKKDGSDILDSVA